MNVNRNAFEQHPYHLVNPSPWPLYTSISLGNCALSFLLYFNYYKNSTFYVLLSLFVFTFFLMRWFTDVVVESTFEGFHTRAVQNGIRFGFILFILSEVMFFSSFFWAFLHCSLNASIDIGSIWPPKQIITLDPWSLPLVNTIILLSSGVTITWSHKAIIDNNRGAVLFGIAATIGYGLIFSLIQYYEYLEAPFNINDSIYGSLFFMLTGFHGAHVFVGSVFLIICFFRQVSYHFLAKQHIGFECAIYYWHFVDVVWLFLFLLVYIWGN
jgi:heme/copper-type cytochrome/quinol oxidase subunit 3